MTSRCAHSHTHPLGRHLLPRDKSAVTICSVDATLHSGVHDLVANMLRESTLGICAHSAGVLSDRLLANLNIRDARAVYGTKACGGSFLASVQARTCARELVLFSSISSWLGSVGQGNYSAANAALDAVAGSCSGSGISGVKTGARIGVRAQHAHLLAQFTHMRAHCYFPLPNMVAISGTRSCCWARQVATYGRAQRLVHSTACGQRH